ncbi:MAG: hypothetical protein IT289_05830 [Oligoflexia bacterium]|nr:hypothetical protein [Oligoflexia bacterium]
MVSHRLGRVLFASLLGACVISFTAGCVTSPQRTTEEPETQDLLKKLSKLRGQGPRKRILVLPFINLSSEKSIRVAKNSRDALVKGLKLTDNFVIVDNNDISKDIGRFVKGDQYEIEEIGKIASEMGVVAIVEGRVLEIKAKRSGDDIGLIRSVSAEVNATVGVRVYSAQSKKEILNEVRSASSEAKTHRVLSEARESLAADPELTEEALLSAFKGMILPITKSVDKVSWGGKIAAVIENRVYVNAGRITGLQIGDILRVSEEGNSIYDPDTGAFIGKGPGHMKGTLEVVSYFGKDGAIAVVHSGSGFRENDIVELY